MIVDIETIGVGITRAKEAHTSLGQRMRDTIHPNIVIARAEPVLEITEAEERV